MDEIFGRVTAILFAAAVFMGMPLLYMSERAKSAEQMYLLTVNTEFVDSICNPGFLTMEMYQQFYKEISAASGIYEFERGDYLKVAIIKKKGWMDFVGNRDSSVNVLYGGTVRYEDF